MKTTAITTSLFALTTLAACGGLQPGDIGYESALAVMREVGTPEVQLRTVYSDCREVGLNDSCNTLREGTTRGNTITITLTEDVTGRRIEGEDISCSRLAHELMHKKFGDPEHKNPRLWYQGYLITVLCHLNCPVPEGQECRTITGHY